eukprot:scaffold9345_cov120-Cylindrotheca_fusiformis.AAC.18
MFVSSFLRCFTIDCYVLWTTEAKAEAVWAARSKGQTAGRTFCLLRTSPSDYLKQALQEVDSAGFPIVTVQSTAARRLIHFPTATSPLALFTTKQQWHDFSRHFVTGRLLPSGGAWTCHSQYSFGNSFHKGDPARRGRPLVRSNVLKVNSFS